MSAVLEAKGSRNSQAREAEPAIMEEGRPGRNNNQDSNQEGPLGYNTYMPLLGEPISPIHRAEVVLQEQPFRRNRFQPSVQVLSLDQECVGTISYDLAMVCHGSQLVQ